MKKTATVRFRVYGIVQGVGFRPTVDRHARTAKIHGSVCNKGPYVEIYAQGTPSQIDHFHTLLQEQPPRRAAILKIDRKPVPEPERVYTDFSIIESEKTSGEIYISPDIAICEECEQELYDPGNRRYLHPFINCTCCGPRMTILDALPYDRERTSMKMFPMCGPCADEYYGAWSRRYDAQPVCCNDCGPEVYLLEPEWKKEQAHMDPLDPEGTRTEGTGGEGSGAVLSDEHRKTGRGRTRGGVRAEIIGRDAITAARRMILDGGIVAVKGIGGFHLCCDATREEAVQKLRARKRRPAKPFAVMMRDEETVLRECRFNEEQREILTGHQKPILLLERRSAGEKAEQAEGPAEPDQIREFHRVRGNDADPGTPRLAPSVAPGNPKVGVMLPYAPLQHLLFRYDDGLEMPDCLVMTSGNVSGAPICRDDADALAELSGFCDCILSHDRLIRIRADDSVMDFHRGHPYMIRRSRGYAPLPILLSGGNGEGAADGDEGGSVVPGGAAPKTLPEASTGSAQKEPAGSGCVLAVGGELKNTFCIASGDLFYLSPYVGDLEDLRTVRALEETIGRMEKLLEVSPQAVVCDLHPKYNATMVAEEIAEKRNIPLIRIQHHYAHVLSCMAENDRSDPVIGVSFDGTGYGTDGTIWGGEILTADYHGFTRQFSIDPFLQIGGDSAPRQGWRIAASMLWEYCKNSVAKAAADTSPDSGPVQAGGRGSREGTDAELTDPAERYFSIVGKLGLCDLQNAKAQRMMAERGIQAVPSTSAGRLFDAVSAVLGICRTSTYEGEASIELEFAAERFAKRVHLPGPGEGTEPGGQRPSDFPENSAGSEAEKALEELSDIRARIVFPEDSSRLPTGQLFAALLERVLQGEDPEKLAYDFHCLLAEFVVQACVRLASREGIRTVALTGGCYQNRLLLTLTEDGLRANGFEVLLHHLVPPNDGGIALGQAAAAVMREKNCEKQMVPWMDHDDETE